MVKNYAAVICETQSKVYLYATIITSLTNMRNIG